MTSEYNPDIHITAGELRDAGIILGDEIPDCGWISKKDYLSAIAQMTTHVVADGGEERTFAVSYQLQLPPFFWVKIKAQQ